ncbi:hypothetical protein [Sphingobium cloacae]|uniref:hypothetical protein n=1 Tax=Sphingobium cloacae TaxID=120107 RepID=UPI00082B0705|nr:hypothetical protein [Sphingobium cloacae]
MTGKRRFPSADTCPVAANDNLPPISKEAQAAILRIARIIGRQIAREEMARMQAENDNEVSE